jgi:hypothetical protein
VIGIGKAPKCFDVSEAFVEAFHKGDAKAVLDQPVPCPLRHPIHYGGYGGYHYGGCYGGGFAAGAVTGAAVGAAATATAAYYNQYPTGVYYHPVY